MYVILFIKSNKTHSKMHLLRLLLSLLISSSLFSFVRSENQNKNTRDIKNTFNNAIKDIGLSDVKEFINMIQSVRPETSSSISQITDQSGKFDYVKNLMEYNYGDILPENIDKLFKLFLEDNMFETIADDYKLLISKTIKRHSLQVVDSNSEFKAQKFQMIYQNEQGSMFIILFHLKPSPVVEGAVRYTYSIISTYFKPSRPYYILTSTDCDLFSCDRTDSIVYMPATITTADINAIIQMNINSVLAFVQNSLLLEK